MSWLIRDENGSPLCNFCPEVVSLVNVYSDSESEPTHHVRLTLNFGGDQRSEVLTVPLLGLDETKWLDKNLRCLFHPEASPGKVNRYVHDRIRSALPSARQETIYCIDRVGLHVVNGVVAYCTGGGLLCPPASADNMPNIELKPMPYRLDIDASCSEHEAAAGMLELVSLSPNPGRIILAHMLMNITSHVYKEAWKMPCICIFLYGKTGTKKTTYSAFLTQMYNRAKGITSPLRLNASIAAAVNILKENNDCVVVLDDLFPSESRQIKGQQEETLLEVTRFIADGTLPARMRGNHVSKEPPACGVLFVGEYVIGTGSDAARLLPVEMTPPNVEKLKRFQDNPLIVSTFYSNYIQWLIDNYVDIRKLLKEWLTAYRLVNLGIHDRLQEAHYFLNTAYALLLQYCFDKDFISKQDAQRLHRDYLTLLTELVQVQDKRVKQGKRNTENEIDYLAQVRAMYLSDNFVIAGTAKQFIEGQHDGVLHNSCLCLRGESLQTHFPTINLTEITDSLLAQGALKPSKCNRTIQISSLRGKRFYAIPLDKLC